MRRDPLAAVLFCSLALAPASFAQTLAAADVTPALPTDRDSVVAQVKGYGCSPDGGATVDVEGNEVTVSLPAFTQCFRPFFWTVNVEIGRLEAGPYTLDAVVDGELFARRFFVVHQESDQLSLQRQRFRVSLEWRDASGNTGFAKAVRLGDDSGYFWFFEPDNSEVLLKVLDGTAINGHFWVFAGSLTDVETTITVMDVGDGLCLELPVFPPDCPTRKYVQPLGENHNVFDTEAFPDN